VHRCPRDPSLGDRIELELVDPARHARRYYALVVAEDPQLAMFGAERGLVLVVVRGRLERRRVVRRLAFGSLAALGREWRRLLRLRVRHRYVVTGRVLATKFGAVEWRRR
jgi:hypothetical protein